MKFTWRAALLIAVSAAFSSIFADGRRPVAAETASASTVALDVFAQPTAIDLLTVEEQGKTAALFHVRSIDGGASWSVRHAIDLGGKAIAGVHRGMDPQIAAVGDALLAMWTTPGNTQWGDGPLATSISRDGGRTWTPGPNPADDGTADGHSFLELGADARGRFHAFWLDSRDGGQGLRGSVSADQGRTWTKNVSLDARTCECCWNKSLSIRPDNLFVLYRDKDPRDMALAVTEDGGKTWSRRATVGAFNWGFDGCPHVGGGLAETHAASVHYVHAIVWTGAEGREGAYVLRSGDDGRRWSEPHRLGNQYARHSDLAGHGSDVAAVWDETGGGRSAILVATSRDQGATWGQPQQLSAAVHASHPLVVASGGGFVAFWTEQTPHGELTWKTAIVGAVRATSTGSHAGRPR
jgi:hypothetical protein